MNKGLIYDLGFHVGQDTDFYLKKGFWVLAVDANPILVEEGKKRFAEFIEAGRLVLLNVGIGRQEEILPFYINKKLSEWSSFDEKIGKTRGEFEVINVQVINLTSLLRKYGVPYYIKVDIEGYDLIAIESLREFDDKPQYVSVENGQVHMIEELYSQGYHKFKFVNQAKIQDVVLPYPAREGKYIDYKFPFGSSGPFGEEIEGEWLDKEEVTLKSRDYCDNPYRDANIHGWYDLHAAL